MSESVSSPSNCGSLWNRWDLHFHTPSSFDYENKSITNQQIVESLSRAGIRAVAITDHHYIDVDRINELNRIADRKLTIFPGIELRDDHGGDPIHYICIFPETCNLSDLWTTLQGSLGLTQSDIANKGGDQKVYVPIEKGAEAAHALGGIVSIHAGVKSNSIESIKNSEQFQHRIKYDITKNFVDVFEIGQLKDIETHLNIIFPSTGLTKPLFICSDNHKATEYAVKANLWLRADPTFRGLQMVLREPRSRVFIGDRPPDLYRVEQNKTKYIHSLSFNRHENTSNSEAWFSGNIEFNTGLVAVIGNKGSGKSALVDMLGLLGCSKNSESFSFLNKHRFCHPSKNLAAFFDATLEWVSGEKTTKNLSELIRPEDVERLKYLPQDHVETVCNELAGLGESGFEHELKAVIFSHVPETDRLGNSTLDELLRFQTEEKQKRIDTLVKQLREQSRTRAILEAQSNPSVKKELVEKLKQKNNELITHEGIKPATIDNPSEIENQTSGEVEQVKIIEAANLEKEKIREKITEKQEEISKEERRRAISHRLIEKLGNFEKDFGAFVLSLDDDLSELGLDSNDLIKLKIENAKVIEIESSAITNAEAARDAIDSKDHSGLQKQFNELDKQISELKGKLDEPQRRYQDYLNALELWENKRLLIVGTEDDPESIKGLETSLDALTGLPEKMKLFAEKQVDLSLQIQKEKIAQAEVLRKMYGPVQNFIDSHDLAKEKLKLEFRVELVNEDFSAKLLDALSQNRKGSFMGLDEGRERIESYIQSIQWDKEESLASFLKTIDNALHNDQREPQKNQVQIADQLAKGRKVEDLFDMLYSLEYIRPKYILRWDGRDLSMLSPGERGTLLLVFYLLIDKSDTPLIIDQPEGNLDNHTVAKVLVECIKEAREHRQVFLVTHNPNLAVVCDADQVIHADMDKANNNSITYTSGSLEDPRISRYVTDVLEGTIWAFRVRDKKYSVGE